MLSCQNKTISFVCQFKQNENTVEVNLSCFINIEKQQICLADSANWDIKCLFYVASSPLIIYLMFKQ